MDMKLNGKVALVTGAARDVGREIALSLAAEGAAVAVNYNGSHDAATAVVAEIANRGGKAIAYKADVSDLAQVKAMVVVACGQDSTDIGPPLAERITARLPHGTLEVWPGRGHFGPQEDPDACAASILHLAGN